MGRNLIAIYGLPIGVALAFSSAHADDRKSAGRLQERREATFTTRKQEVVVAQPERISVRVIRPFQTSSQEVTNRRSIGNDGTNNDQAHRYKSLTFFHFNSKFGEVAVKPVIGHVTGAEFSINF